MIFDTHSHYNDAAFLDDLPAIVRRFPEAGICGAVNVASDLSSIDEVLTLSKAYPQFYAALGIHPSDCAPLTERRLFSIRDKLHEPKVVAVGEIGLDYHYNEPEREVQKEWFRRQLRMAQEADLPVIIHSRDAAQDTMQILQEEQAHFSGGVIHCYSYSPEMAEQFVRMGFYIGVGGVVTFKNGRRLKETVQRIPLECIVLETDCPYMAPVPHRGERNSSLYLPLVVSEIAQLLQIPEEKVIRVTYENAKRLYRLEKRKDSAAETGRTSPGEDMENI
ncbi:MAG: TatD family hydrolase [Firmicutes bacterium]|nr:TatD family hydrolase [Bacillota bacterium]